MRIPTMTVDRGGVAVVINQRDFKPGKDRVWGAAEPVKPVEAKDEQAELIAKLAAHGIKRDRRASIDTLKRLLAEAEA